MQNFTSYNLNKQQKRRNKINLAVSKFIWGKKDLWHSLLLPLSACYWLVITVRYYFYKLNIFRSTRLSVPVIIIGNISVGGSGKTPFIIWLANLLKQNGCKPGIVSRGYGGSFSKNNRHATITVEPASDPELVGDEALLIYTSTLCPVVVSANRVNAGKKLLSENQCDIILSDDGLQHYRLKRDLEINLIDGLRGFGNGWLLPAGPLRENKSRASHVDYNIINGSNSALLNFLPNSHKMSLTPGTIYNLKDPTKTKSVADLQSYKLHITAAIGNPDRFLHTLHKLNLKGRLHPFPDHHNFNAHDFFMIANEPNSLIIMTEKDAVKCQKFATDKFWVVPIDVVLPQEFCGALVTKIVSLRK